MNDQPFVFQWLRAFVYGGHVGTLTPNALRVLWVLYQHADAAGLCWPGAKRISDQTGIRDLGRVRRARRELIESGLAEAVDNEQGGRRWEGLRIRLILPRANVDTGQNPTPVETRTPPRAKSDRGGGADFAPPPRAKSDRATSPSNGPDKSLHQQPTDGGGAGFSFSEGEEEDLREMNADVYTFLSSRHVGISPKKARELARLDGISLDAMKELWDECAYGDNPQGLLISKIEGFVEDDCFIWPADIEKLEREQREAEEREERERRMRAAREQRERARIEEASRTLSEMGFGGEDAQRLASLPGVTPFAIKLAEMHTCTAKGFKAKTALKAMAKLIEQNDYGEPLESSRDISRDLMALLVWTGQVQSTASARAASVVPLWQLERNGDFAFKLRLEDRPKALGKFFNGELGVYFCRRADHAPVFTYPHFRVVKHNIPDPWPSEAFDGMSAAQLAMKIAAELDKWVKPRKVEPAPAATYTPAASEEIPY